MRDPLRPFLVTLGILLGFALLWQPSRDVVLLQHDLGAILIFVIHLGFALLPAWLAWSPRGGFLDRSRPGAHIRRLRSMRPDALAWFIIVMVVGFEAAIDPQVTRLLGYNWTDLMPRIEGDAVLRAQQLRTPLLDVAFTALYTYGYLALYGVLPGFLVLRGDVAAARALMRTLVLAWCIGLPSYLFVVVDEPWVIGHSTNVLHETLPPSRDNELVQASVNNELPSLHSLLSVAVVSSLWYQGRRRLARWFAPVGLGIPVATVYLGIHWLTDALTGIVLGGLVAQASRDPAWLARLLPARVPKAEIPPAGLDTVGQGATP